MFLRIDHREQASPDHSTLSRFRTALTKTGTFEILFKEINKQLEQHKIIVKTGAILDASVIDTPLRPKGKSKHKVTQDRENEQEVEVKRSMEKKVDKDGSWLKKR